MNRAVGEFQRTMVWTLILEAVRVLPSSTTNGLLTLDSQQSHPYHTSSSYCQQKEPPEPSIIVAVATEGEGDEHDVSCLLSWLNSWYCSYSSSTNSVGNIRLNFIFPNENARASRVEKLSLVMIPSTGMRIKMVELDDSM